MARDSKIVELFISTLAFHALYAEESPQQAEADLPPAMSSL